MTSSLFQKVYNLDNCIPWLVIQIVSIIGQSSAKHYQWQLLLEGSAGEYSAGVIESTLEGDGFFTSILSEAGRTLLVDLSTVIELIQDESNDHMAVNIPRKLSQISENLTSFLRGKYIN